MSKDETKSREPTSASPVNANGKSSTPRKKKPLKPVEPLGKPESLQSVKLSGKARRRRPEPVAEFGNSFGAAVQQLSAEFLRGAAYKHRGTKGTVREQAIASFLREHLPRAYTVSGGEVIDSSEARSPQLDVMVFDGMRNHAITTGDSCLLPAEALLASVEVKSKLTREEIAKSLIAAARLKALKPFKLPLAVRRRGGQAANAQARYFHCIFAFSTDIIQGPDWLSKEYARIAEVANELGVSPQLVDRLFVVRRGLIDVDAGTGFNDSTDGGTTLMFFYMHLLMFVLRENRRRKPVPYLEYAGRMGSGWQPIVARSV